MTDFKTAKNRLLNAISARGCVNPGADSVASWGEIEDAIRALDNAAYERAEEKVRGEIRAEAERALRFHNELVAERNAARRDTTTMTLANDDKRQELRRLKRDIEDERAHREHVVIELTELQRQFDEARAERDGFRGEIELLAERTSEEIEHLTAERDLARTEFKREATDAGRLARERNEARIALTGERRAVEWTLKGRAEAREDAQYWRGIRDHEAEEGNQALVERDRLQHTLSDLKNVLWRRGYRGGEAARLRAALETLADRYHAQMCYKNRRSPHQRGGCELVAAVSDANAALGGFQISGEVPSSEVERLRQILTAMCERHHIECCPAEGHPVGHGWKDCPSKPFEMEDAEKALVGESVDASGGTISGGDLKFFETDDEQLNEAERQRSEPTLRVHTYGEEGTGRTRIVRKVVGEREAWQIIEQVEGSGVDIEAVLIGSRELACADGCGRVVRQGNAMYRYRYLPPGVIPHLYATKECVRKVANEVRRRRRAVEREAAGYPYGRPSDPVRCRCALPEEKLPAIYKCHHRYPSGRTCGWMGAARDLSPTGRCPRCYS